MTDAVGHLRADARRNHENLLAAARDVFVERGPDAPLDEVARRAGVGIGTLYRRFPDRTALAHAVVVDALTRTACLAEEISAEQGEPFAALAAYLHGVLDLRTPAVIPALLAQLDLESAEIAAARERSAAAIEALIDAARQDGSLRPDVTFADIGLMLVRIARPLPGNLPPSLQDDLAHRHVALLLDALRARPVRGSRRELPGPALTRRDLNRGRKKR